MSLDPPSPCHKLSHLLGPPPLERDVLYGRPLSVYVNTVRSCTTRTRIRMSVEQELHAERHSSSRDSRCRTTIDCRRGPSDGPRRPARDLENPYHHRFVCLGYMRRARSSRSRSDHVHIESSCLTLRWLYCALSLLRE